MNKSSIINFGNKERKKKKTIRKTIHITHGMYTLT
jgi:hypothetical protein